MRQDSTSALAGLASFAKLQALIAARSHGGYAEGTMTCEAFATFQTSWDRKDNGRHFALEGGLLRVWHKMDGKWLIAASFQHPYDDTPVEQ